MVILLVAAYQHKSRICRSKTSFATNTGTANVLRQMEIELSSAPKATMVDTVDLSFFSPAGKQTSGLKACSKISTVQLIKHGTGQA